MKSKSFDLINYINKEFYIIDCKDFTYFARKIHVVGFEMTPNELIFITDVKKNLIDEPKKFYKEELEQFKSFEEARKKAKQLNEISKNRERAKQWFRDRQTILEMQYNYF